MFPTRHISNPVQHSKESRADFIRRVYGLLSFSLLFTAAGAYLGLGMPFAMYWPAVIVEFILLLAALFLHRSSPLNVILLVAFTFMTGVTLGPSLGYYIAIGAGSAIPMAAGTTALLFGALSVYALVSKQDFSFLRGFLFAALLSMIIFSFVMMLFNIPFNTVIYSYLGVIVFCGFVLYDTSNLLRRYTSEQATAATIALFLDIINLFMFLLRIFAGSRRN